MSSLGFQALDEWLPFAVVNCFVLQVIRGQLVQAWRSAVGWLASTARSSGCALAISISAP